MEKPRSTAVINGHSAQRIRSVYGRGPEKQKALRQTAATSSSSQPPRSMITGEITGTVTRNDRPAPSVCLELSAADGTLIRTTTAAYDGFYNFAAVRPGTYSVRLDGAAPRTVTISADHTFEGADFSLAGEKP
jgi:hypothetical protein